MFDRRAGIHFFGQAGQVVAAGRWMTGRRWMAASLMVASALGSRLDTAMDAQRHWETVYGAKAPDKVSWYRPHLDTSRNLIERATSGRFTASIIDAGGGAFGLVDNLISRGYGDVTVLDRHVIVSTFAPEAPVKCSGLDVVRCDARSPAPCETLCKGSRTIPGQVSAWQVLYSYCVSEPNPS
jgi:hypothetical protein